MKTSTRLSLSVIVLTALALISATPHAPNNQSPDPSPPDHPVKLIFIHHSTGENWLTDGYGDLGKTLSQNNYFVSDTNYGWGPEAIGDRTDIPNWTEWFASENTPAYMDALLNENEQHASYTRTLADPGGENEIIMFKSCFPNSALEGNPNDPPGSYEELSVGGAKYVYNTILQYFATRPDKLFIVITAPPLSDNAYAENARAFNNWLVDDWLNENNYTLQNVAVFDFYNILTDPGAHHRFNNGGIERILGNQNTLYYPSEDDHPSVEGSRKAAEEFAPLLNIFYHRWRESAPTEPLSPNLNPTNGAIPPGSTPLSPTANLIAGFEGGEPLWEAFHDEAASSTMTCQFEPGAGRNGDSLLLNFNLTPASWGTCARFFDDNRDWSASDGISFYFRAEKAGIYFDIDIYAGPAEGYETYLYTVETTAESAADWTPIVLQWSDFKRASWEQNPDTPFAKANEVRGMAFGLGAPPDTTYQGSLRVDDLSLLTPEPAQPPEESEPSARNPLPCVGALLIPLMAVIAFPGYNKGR